MTVAAILRETAAEGVTLSLSASGTIKAVGEQAAVTRWLTTIKENKAGIVALLAETANEKPFEATRWMIHFADRNPLEVAFSPAVSHAEVLECYPGALAAEPIEPGRRRPGERLAGDDDRHTCLECGNLRGGVCAVARPGGAVSAVRGYRPSLVDVPIRCAGFA